MREDGIVYSGIAERKRNGYNDFVMSVPLGF